MAAAQSADGGIRKRVMQPMVPAQVRQVARTLRRQIGLVADLRLPRQRHAKDNKSE
jgi:hypothetical protein